jgi:hypothetical protein
MFPIPDVSRRSVRRALALAAAIVAVSVAGCAALEFQERELLFRPTHEAAGWYSGKPDAVEEVFLPAAAAGERIHAWWWPAENPDAPVVYYLHGVRWNLTGQLNRISQLRRFGFSVFAIDYRGFGQSDGDVPSETTVYEDARIGWQWLVAHEPDASKRYIYGHSLGGAVAIDLAAQVSREAEGARGLIVESSFTTLHDVVSEMGYGWVPVSQKFDSISKIGQVRMPVLLVHGAEDRYVPSRLSEALYAAAPQPKKLLLIANGTHNNSAWLGDAEYRQALRELFGPIDGIPVNRGQARDVLEGRAATAAAVRN